MDILFWEEELGYYVLDHASTAIMADGLNGQRFCETTGLQDILPTERISSHLHQVYERCVQPFADYTGDGEGDIGAVNGRNADGSAVGIWQADEVWTGSTYFVAAMMYRRGGILGDPVLQEEKKNGPYDQPAQDLSDHFPDAQAPGDPSAEAGCQKKHAETKYLHVKYFKTHSNLSGRCRTVILLYVQ